MLDVTQAFPRPYGRRELRIVRASWSRGFRSRRERRWGWFKHHYPVENGTPAVRPVRKSKGLPRDGLVAETDAAGANAGITPLIP